MKWIVESLRFHTEALPHYRTLEEPSFFCVETLLVCHASLPGETHIHKLRICMFECVSHPSAVPPMWRWGSRCRDPWWPLHSGWSWPPAAGRGRRCKPESDPGPRPQRLAPQFPPPPWPLLSTAAVLRHAYTLCYHPEDLTGDTQREEEDGCFKPWHHHRSHHKMSEATFISQLCMFYIYVNLFSVIISLKCVFCNQSTSVSE